MRSPGRGSRRTDGSQKSWHTTDVCWRLIGLHSGDPSGRQKAAPLLGASPTTANQPSQLPNRDVCTSLQSSPPRAIERLQAVQVNVQAGDYSRLDAKFSGVLQKRRTDGGFCFAVAVSGRLWLGLSPKDWSIDQGHNVRAQASSSNIACCRGDPCGAGLRTANGRQQGDHKGRTCALIEGRTITSLSE